MNIIPPFNEDIAVVLIDSQARLMGAMATGDLTITTQKMFLEAMNILDIDCFVTEQYPKGLGHTVEALARVIKDLKVYEKTEFSCLDNIAFAQNFLDKGYKTAVLMGVESHICVQQTALALLENNINVVIIADAVDSRNIENKRLALNLMTQCGAFVTSAEAFIFGVLKGAKHPKFREVSKLIK